jgi:hypothetical protein
MSFWGRLKAVKCFLRDSIFFDIKEVPVVCHAPDNPEESVRLKHILLSVNNLNNNNKRFTQRYTNQFIDMLNAFKSWCTESNIPITDTVIVGSAPMVVFGIRKTNDIDFTFMPEYRKRLYGDGIHKISDTLKIVGKDFYSIGNEIISDETIITDDNLYFWFYGCKFLNLELVYKMKQSKRHLKDIEDLKLLDLFAELESVFDGKAALRKQVEDEMQRRKLHI